MRGQQRGRRVEEPAGQSGLESLLLPSSSPDLNLPERLWKCTGKACPASEYRENFAAFKGAIAGFWATVPQRHAEDLQPLPTLNSQQFAKAQSMAA